MPCGSAAHRRAAERKAPAGPLRRRAIRLLYGLLLLALLPAAGCMDYGPHTIEQLGMEGPALFVVNEGNFLYGNASLTCYDPRSGRTENEVFLRANGFKLGDVAQSMVIHEGRGYLVMNNSGTVFVIDPDTFRCTGQIRDLTSPRYIHFVTDSEGRTVKGYITDLYAFSITVFDPETLRITGRIPTDVFGRTQPSTEQMVQWGDYVFTNCWSYDNRILVIDTRTDRVVDQIEVGRQPTSLALDCYGKLWTLTDGGYEGSPYGEEPPALWRIDAATRQVERRFELPAGESGELCTNGARDTLYFLDKHVWCMAAAAETLPEEPLLPNDTNNHWYGLAVDPLTSEIYLADAIDYAQPGVVYRYSARGRQLDRFKTGIIPGAFCFKQSATHDGTH